MSNIEQLNINGMTYKSSYFVGDTPVMLKGGYKRIDEINVGDFVYTHTGTLKKVINVFKNGNQNIIRIRIDGIDDVETTENQKFYIIHDEKLDWVKCKDIKLNSYVCVLKCGSNACLPKEPIPEELLFMNNIEELSKLYVFRKILKVEDYKCNKTTYGIEVDIDHSFCITNGVIGG